jgi:predicted HTH transcriptional regulator
MNLLEIFNQLDAAALHEFIRQRQEENLHLDFKTVSNANLNGPFDKKNLAKAVSGFANSSGGLIVWGVDARKNPDGIDCASVLNEISPIQLFVSRLTTLTGQSVSPLVDGIIHKPINFGAEKAAL